VPGPGIRLVLLLAALLIGVPGVCAPASAQETAGTGTLVLEGPEGQVQEVSLSRHRGYPAVPVRVLELLGWTVTREDDRYLALLPAPAGGVPEGSAPRMTLHPGAPFVLLDGAWAQLVEAPYEVDDALYLPLQLVSDLLPDRLPGRYTAGDSRSLRVNLPGGWGGAEPAPPAPVPAPAPVDPTRVVIIDPGHGGVDPGALGRRRSREKDVTLAIGRALAERLSGEEGLEVYLTRNADTLVALWERGEIATELKGERYGVFLSIHANSVSNRQVRGVETFFLSEARTDHEARVAALENSVVELERGRSGPRPDELGGILSELMHDDFQHWSYELANLAQRELAAVHPGPNRGVKQGPFAVLTNTMMPSILVEIGFLSHPREEEVLSDADFHRDVAEALGTAVLRFFERYPPGAERAQAGR
jgi:N-acetylmuramoyl-L-alanine amidase